MVPPVARKKLPKGDVDEDTSDVTSLCGAMLPPAGKKKVRHSDTDSDKEQHKREKRQKPNSPRVRRVRDTSAEGLCTSATAVTVVAKEVTVGGNGGLDVVGAPSMDRPIVDEGGAADAATETTDGTKRSKRAKKRAVLCSDVSNGGLIGGGYMGELKAVTGSLMDVVLVDGVDRAVGRLVSKIAAEYELIVMRLITENAHLKGKLEGGGGFAGVSSPPVSRVGVVTLPGKPAGRAPYPELPKPVETWSVVVKGKNTSSSKEVVQKVVKEVAPTLGVRVHDVRPMKSGGAVIRTPSVAERTKIAANKKFAEVGLEVAVNDKLGPRVVVRGVHTCISPDEFMDELYGLNLSGLLTPEAYKKSVRLVTAPWRSGDEGQVNITLECTEGVAEQLRRTGAYIKWFRFQVRTQDAVQGCYRCLGLDHRVRECRMKVETCLRCGLAGHRASNCPNEIGCRDCRFKGLPADHRMLSMACPIYGAMVARANSRH